MKIIETLFGINNKCTVFEQNRHEDDRGFFQELYRCGLCLSPNFKIEQINYSISNKNVVRGLHCSPYPKLCSCIKGRLFDVAVDLRKDSPTYLQWGGTWLDENNRRQLYVPANCGHGFFSAEDNTVLLYCQGGTWEAGLDKEYNWRDPAFNIDWPETEEYILSEKDKNAAFFDT